MEVPEILDLVLSVCRNAVKANCGCTEIRNTVQVVDHAVLLYSIHVPEILDTVFRIVPKFCALCTFQNICTKFISVIQKC